LIAPGHHNDLFPRAMVYCAISPDHVTVLFDRLDDPRAGNIAPLIAVSKADSDPA
jgi:hypothetical protein